MTTLGSLTSAAESSMDDGGGSNRHRLQTLCKTNSFNTTVTATTAGQFPDGFFDDGVSQEEAENCDGGVWATFAESFRQVQSVLDRNRLLIQQVNENHQSKIHDNMVKNVALIQEINRNISKVVSLYSNLSTNFSSLFRQQNTSVDAKNDDGKGDDDLQPPIDPTQTMTAEQLIFLFNSQT